MNSFVKVIAHSKSAIDGSEVVTVHARYWRAIHAEMMTHGMLSKNARSSRAVPSMTLLSEPIFVPQFGMNKKGMQSEILASPQLQQKWAEEWIQLAEACREQVGRWAEEGMHKQHANRPLEWFGWIDVLITGVEWKNFYELRISKYAQPEFDELARSIQHEILLSTPRLLQPGEWHLPYVDARDRKAISKHLGFESDLTNAHPCADVLSTMRKLSVARCARLSYRPFDGNANIEAEIERYNGLVVSRPVHASPAEHQCTPDNRASFEASGFENLPRERRPLVHSWKMPHLHANLTGWVQLRKLIPHNYIQG